MANACLLTMLPERVVRQGATIVLNQKDPVVSGALALNVYEPEQTSFFLAACEPGSVFLDIGANSGYYTALFLSHAGPGGRAIALEPDPECFEVLQRHGAGQRRHKRHLPPTRRVGCPRYCAPLS